MVMVTLRGVTEVTEVTDPDILPTGAPRFLRTRFLFNKRYQGSKKREIPGRDNARISYFSYFGYPDDNAA
jgi:hypothetical protein